MAKKYHIDFVNVDGSDISLEISNDSWGGASTPLRLERDSVVLTGENAKALNGQLLDFTIMASAIGQYNELFNSPSTDNLVQLKRDGVVEFSGYIENKVFKETLTNANIWSIDVSCHSGFQWMKEHSIDDVIAITRQDNKTVMQYIWEVLEHVSITFDRIDVYSSVRSYNPPVGHDTIFDSYMRGYALIGADGKGKTIYEFLNKFLLQWNCYMVKSGDRIVIQKRDELSDAVATTRRLVVYTDYNTKVISTPLYATKRSIVDDSFYIKGSASHEISNGIKQIEITENFTRLDELVDNTTANSIIEKGDFIHNDSFVAEAEAAIVGQWYAKTGTEMSVGYNEGEDAWTFSGLDNVSVVGKDLTIINNGIYQRVATFNHSASGDQKKLKVSFDITGYSSHEDMGGTIWMMYKNDIGWETCHISHYKGISGSVKTRLLDQTDINGMTKRPIPSGKNIGQVVSGETTSVTFEFDFANDLRDIGDNGLEQDESGIDNPFFNGRVDFIVGFQPLRHGNNMFKNNFHDTSQYVGNECVIKNISIKFEQSDIENRTGQGNVNTYDSNLNYRKTEKIKIEYPINLQLAYQNALLEDNNWLPIQLLYDTSWGLSLQYHNDLLAIWRISETSIPYNKLSFLIRNTGATLKVGELITLIGQLAGDYVVTKVTWDVSQGNYKVNLVEFKKETSITIT